MIKRGKLTKKQAWSNKDKYQEISDPRFETWRDRHQKNYLWTMIAAIIFSWRINKIFYSRFYSHPMYTAYWNKAKEYRNLVHWYGIITLIVIDLLLIVVDIPGIIAVEWGN